MTLANEVPNSNELQEKIEKIKGRIRDRKSRVEEIIAENEKRERHNTRLSIIQEQQTDFENQLDELSANIGEIEDKLSHVEILKKAFSTNGLLAYKIENLVKDLEVLTNEYLAELSDGRFSLEFVVLNDKLNVEIDDNGKKVDILALSAGELARVNTSTLLAIRKLMSSISKSRINVLFLDEVTNVLDELGKERMVDHDSTGRSPRAPRAPCPNGPPPGRARVTVGAGCKCLDVMVSVWRPLEGEK